MCLYIQLISWVNPWLRRSPFYSLPQRKRLITLNETIFPSCGEKRRRRRVFFCPPSPSPFLCSLFVYPSTHPSFPQGGRTKNMQISACWSVRHVPKRSGGSFFQKKEKKESFPSRMYEGKQKRREQPLD